MKTRWWLFALSIVFFLGWLSGRRPWAVDAPTPVVERPVSPSSSARSAREPNRKQWAERLRDRDLQGLPDLIATIPGKDLGPSIEAWLDSFGIEGLDRETIAKVWKILDVWVADDADAAWNWALG